MSARDYLGIPYKVNGDPPDGADCYSLVRHYAARELGVELPPYMYSVENCYAASSMFIADADKQMSTRWRKVPREIGAVVVFRVMGLVMHCGVMISARDFLHAFEGRNSSIESLEDFYWSKRVAGFFKYE